MATIDYDDSNTSKADANGLFFSFYLDPVQVKDRPLAEAAFMQRASNIGFATGQVDSESTSRTGEGDYLSVGYTHMAPDSPLWLQVIHTQASNDYKNTPAYMPFQYTRDSTENEIGIGMFIAQNTIIAIGYGKTEYEYSPSSYSQNDYTVTSTDLIAKHLMPAGNGAIFNIEGGIGFDDISRSNAADEKNNRIALGGDYYFTNHYSVGVSLERTSGDDNGQKGQEIGLHGQFFLTPKFSVLAKIAKFSGQGKSDDYDMLVLQAALRF